MKRIHLIGRQISILRSQENIINWKVLEKRITDPKSRAVMDELRSSWVEIERENKKYSKTPEPINFDHYRSILRNTKLVDALEQDYKNYKYPTYETSDNEIETPELKTYMEEVKEMVEHSKLEIENLREYIKYMKETKTTRDTTMEEMMELYPDLAEEIDQEIAEYNWNKDISK